MACVVNLACTAGADGSLTKTPENVLVLRGEDAILNCSTDSTSPTGENPITWNYDNDIVSYAPCTSQHPGFVTSPLDSATDCNLRALGTWEYGISGVYRCQTGFGRQNRALATVIVLGELAHFLRDKGKVGLLVGQYSLDGPDHSCLKV